MLNCTTSTMDDSNFSRWTPLTGIYIATATLVFAIAITGDLVEGLLSKQYWIPSGYASLNSISLAILGAATKLSTDLSTTMPRQIDQLVKLGTSAFMCIALASIHPSLGKLENSELLSNIVALSILVISSIVILCIQLRTGVIYAFKTAHAVMLTMMSLLLLHCILSAAFLSCLKLFHRNKYQKQDQSARKEWIDVEDNMHPQIEKLKQYLKRFSVLAYCGCPHFWSSRTFQGTPPTIYGLVAAIAFFVTQITSLTHGDNDGFLVSTSGSSVSAYDWSVLWIFMTQSMALGVGTIVLCIRGYYIARVYLEGLGTPRWKPKLEKFWMRSGGNVKLIHLDYIEYTQHKYRVRRLIMFLLFFIRTFYFAVIVFISVAISVIIERFWRGIMFVCFSTTIPCKLAHSGSLRQLEEELSGQDISLSSEFENEGSVKWIVKSILRITEKDMSAKERKTEHLEELLSRYLSPDFRGIVSFDSEEAAPLVDPEGSPPSCWSLPVVILTNIAIRLPNVDHDSIVELIRGVNEGIVFAKLIEDKFNNQQDLCFVRFAAYAVWEGNIYHGPQPSRLFKAIVRFFRRAPMNFESDFRREPLEILKSLATKAAENFREPNDDSASRKLTAYSVYRLCKTILVELRDETQVDSQRLFEKLRATIADILGACLTNLKQYILTECSSSSSIEKRREDASRILRLFGDTERIMEIIETRQIPEMSREKMVFIDNWREYYLQRRQGQLP